MGQVIIRKLDDAVIAMAKRRAKSDGKSLEQYLRELITENIRPSKAELFARIDEIFEESNYVMKVAPEDLIREDRNSR